jgi:hypothetical protein
MKEGFNNLWPTIILKDIIKDKPLLDDVTNYTLTKYGLDNKISADIKYQNLFDDNYYNKFRYNIVIPFFEKYLQENVGISLKDKKYTMRAWLTGYGVSYSMPKHNHSGSHLSAVFYLLSEDNHLGGSLVINDPRFNANRGYTPDFKKWFEKEMFNPKTGDILIFPSFTYHSVDTYYGKLRLAMPVDLILYNDE